VSPAAGIVHYAWPGGLAVVVEGGGAATAAVFDAGGWRTGPRDVVLHGGPPPGAVVTRLALPADVAVRCTELAFVSGALHTDFVSLPRLGRRLQSDGASATLFVVGPHPAAVVISDGVLTAFDPTRPQASEEDVLKRATGWIVHLAGRMRGPAAPPGDPASAVEAAAAHESAAAPADQAAVPPATRAGPPAAQEPGAPPSGPPASPAAFGRFPPTARFLLAPGARAGLPQAVDAEMAAAVGAHRQQLLALLDGTHTLEAVAAATGLQAAQVAAAVEVLLTHRLAFRYVSRARSGSLSR
jgi:hypothetical protein